MKINIIGINHRTAPIEIREKLAFPKGKLSEGLLYLKKNPRIKESVILSTCNRVEIYTLAEEDNAVPESIADFLTNFHKLGGESFKEFIYRLEDFEAVRHLFRVSSSLDAQVLGENQILAQVRQAYLAAKEAGTVSKIFSYLFDEAIKVGKFVRTETQIGYGAVSIGSAAVELARKIFENLQRKKVLIIGAGKIGELSAKHLWDRGAQMILVANRTLAKAKELAQRFEASVIAFEKWHEALGDVDIVISSVNAPHLLVTKEQAEKIILQRKHRPMFFIDLGMPRNIDPEINSIDNIYVYNLDDLKKITDKNLNERLKEAEKAEQIIEGCLMEVGRQIKRLAFGV
ncbi:MAG: glutamyl-tRNA reductase [Candidatus Omnitrophica bacterium]|nr:glutamyl-tRNA reductase [Candidatus Omnitrophota bacterium]MBU1926026.1 glutamyl-tRNA reductase [Candidatus Omnitrophota bacterium]